MRISAVLFGLVAATLAMSQPPAAFAADDALLGRWIGQSLEADGRTQTGAVANRMQFTFEKDTLKIKGNFADDRKQICMPFTTDASKTPKEFDCILSSSDRLLGIYELDNGELKICIRHASFSSEGRPTEFRTRPDSHLVLVVLRIQGR